jgi:hypothetical protein
MGTTNMAPGATPVLVVDAMELAEYIRWCLANPEHGGGSYTDLFTGNKTDIALSPGGAITAGRIVINSDAHAILGWAFAETTGAAGATVRIHDGSNANGEVFARINLQANESVRDWYIPKGVRCFTGRVFVNVVSGSVEGVIYWI